MEIPCSIENIDMVEQHRRRPLESILIYTHWDILLLFEFCWISSWKSTYGDYYLTPEKKKTLISVEEFERLLLSLKKIQIQKTAAKVFERGFPSVT